MAKVFARCAIIKASGRQQRKARIMRLLLAEDELELSRALTAILRHSGYEVDAVHDGLTALDHLQRQTFDAAVLDIMMPGMDGIEVLRRVRQGGICLPIIMLTAKSDEASELNGFDCGADEYISKPFSPKILTARVDALIRRSYSIDSSEMIDVGGIVINKAAHIVKINDEEIELSFKEFELLTYFEDNKGIALSREKILNNVWNYDYFGDARTIDTHVKKLRKKLGDKGDYIKTIWGMGYKFEVED